jgi:hypothetical protein
MRIGINLDSVIANLEEEFAFRFVDTEDCAAVDRWDRSFLSETMVNMNKRSVDTVLDDEVFWANAIPNDDAWNMVNKWFMSTHDIFIISTRSARHFDVSEWWLGRWGLYYNNLICGAIRGNKNTYIDMFNLDFFVEDDPVEAKRLSESIPTFLLDRNSNLGYDFGGSVRVADCYDVDKMLKEYFEYDS